MGELTLSKHRMNLLKLLGNIASGNMKSEEYPMDFLFSLYKSQRDEYMSGPRNQYVSPLDKSTYRNVGETTNTLTPY